MHFVCVDQRAPGPHGMMITHNKEQLLLPPLVTKVPALYFPDTNQCIFERDISEYLAPIQRKMMLDATKGMGEPMCFSKQGFGSSWEEEAPMMSLEEQDRASRIYTPEEDYTPNKLTADDPALQKYIAMRNAQVPQIGAKI